MPRSQNGYSANDRSLIASYQVTPKVRMTFRKGDVATVMVWAFQRFDKYIESLYVPGCWGYAERPIRGSSTTLSNHASGTAGDGNAPSHPLGVPIPKTFSQKQIDDIRIHILNPARVDGHPVLRWGGNYTGRKDGMHFEIIGTPAQVAKLADYIKNPEKVTNPDGGPIGKFLLPEGHYYAENNGHAKTHSGWYAKDRPAIRRIQKEVGVPITGKFDSNTGRAVAKWRKANGLGPHETVGRVGWEAMVKK